MYKYQRFPHKIKEIIWNSYINQYQNQCFLGCGEQIDKDHFECGFVIPLCYGGYPSINNIRPICKKCYDESIQRPLKLYMDQKGYVNEEFNIKKNTKSLNKNIFIEIVSWNVRIIEQQEAFPNIIKSGLILTSLIQTAFDKYNRKNLDDQDTPIQHLEKFMALFKIAYFKQYLRYPPMIWKSDLKDEFMARVILNYFTTIAY